MQAELEQTYPRLGTIYSLCSVYYPNIRQRSDVLNRRNFLKTGFYEGINFPEVPFQQVRSLTSACFAYLQSMDEVPEPSPQRSRTITFSGQVVN